MSNCLLHCLAWRISMNSVCQPGHLMSLSAEEVNRIVFFELYTNLLMDHFQDITHCLHALTIDRPRWQTFLLRVAGLRLALHYWVSQNLLGCHGQMGLSICPLCLHGQSQRYDLSSAVSGWVRPTMENSLWHLRSHVVASAKKDNTVNGFCHI